jgi:hypothetical protein
MSTRKLQKCVTASSSLLLNVSLFLTRSVTYAHSAMLRSRILQTAFRGVVSQRTVTPSVLHPSRKFSTTQQRLATPQATERFMAQIAETEVFKKLSKSPEAVRSIQNLFTIINEAGKSFVAWCTVLYLKAFRYWAGSWQAALEYADAPFSYEQEIHAGTQRVYGWIWKGWD